MTTRIPGSASRLALESGVIIASILAAFALDTWWDDRKERVEERETLQALHVEFAAAKETIHYYRSLQERILVNTAALSDALNNALEGVDGSIVDGSITVADTTLAWAVIPPTTSVSLGTLRGLISAGRLGIIQNRDLRSALASWGIELDELVEEEADSRTLVYGDLDRVLRARVNTYGLWAKADSVYRDGLALEKGMTRSLPVDTELAGVIHMRKALLIHTLEEHDSLLAAVDNILRLIEESLADA